MACGKWFFLLSHLLLAIELDALGIGASPGVIRFRKIPLGVRVQSTERIVVRNPNPYDSWYRFSVRAENSHGYYEPVPSVEWITLECESVFATAESVSDGVEVFVEIPNEYQYYNRHYAGAIVVSPARSGGIGASIAIIVEIETEPIRDYPETVSNIPFLYPSYACGNMLDSFTIYNDRYGVADYQLDAKKSLIGKDDIENPIYERELFFLFPAKTITVDGKRKKTVYGIFDNWVGEGVITVEKKNDEKEKGFIRVEKCR